VPTTTYSLLERGPKVSWPTRSGECYVLLRYWLARNLLFIVNFVGSALL
jgi:hypothetical protein